MDDHLVERMLKIQDQARDDLFAQVRKVNKQTDYMMEQCIRTTNELKKLDLIRQMVQKLYEHTQLTGTTTRNPMQIFEEAEKLIDDILKLMPDLAQFSFTYGTVKK